MAVRRWRKLAILHKIEATYGTDATPLAADELIGSNVTFTPMEGEEVSRDLMLPYMGHQGVILAGLYGRLEFDIEIAGAGAPGDVPRYGSMLRVCGLAETVTADTSVDYTIIEDGQESGSLYFISEKVQHVLLGGRATVTLTFTPKGIPKFRFTYQGLLGTISDIGAMPAVDQSAWIKPVIVSKANSTMSLHAAGSVAESLTVDLGNTLTPRFLIGDELMLISDRSSTGTAVVEARDIATIDWFAIAQTRARGALALTHGTVDGNIVELAAPAVEIGRPTQGQTDGIVNYTLPMMLCPVTGTDELVLTVR
ncbi:hypothetical protein E0K93_09570 [Puniceibacterium sp. HSS470]|nr:hypothetical protein E0K93_09570 [Puniceibacterium sp. HSS470]|tara:strand:- start:7003 stop:7932 length:930 start_codon:yes stop_codon:yes gene_type:complete